MLNLVPIWAIALLLASLVVVCGELGYLIGERAKASLGESPFAVLQAAVFGLLGLLLAFSFSLGLARYDSRRAEVQEEANAIETTIVRSELLDPASGGDYARASAAIRRSPDFVRARNGRPASQCRRGETIGRPSKRHVASR
jgi:hypothetical protein